MKLLCSSTLLVTLGCCAATHAQQLVPYDSLEGNISAVQVVEFGSSFTEIEIKADFEVGERSDGVVPADELTEVVIGPAPGSTMPSWVIWIPPQCFVLGNRQHEVLDPRLCGGTGVQVLSRDPSTRVDTDITAFIHTFEATADLENGAGSVEIEFRIADISPFGGILPCVLDLKIGNDGTAGLAFARTELAGVFSLATDPPPP